MLRYIANPALKANANVTLAAATANQVISNDFAATAEIAQVGFRAVVELDYTHSANSTLKLQHGVQKLDGTTDWADLGSQAQATLSVSGTAKLVEVTLHPSVALDAAQLPTRPRLRLVLTTGAGSTGTVKAVTILVPEMAFTRASNERSI